MSDLYLELRSRIPVVALRTHIGRDRLQAAQEAVGLSNERLAREIPISEKTWRRWKEAGEVPTYALPKVAQVLRLELVETPSALEALNQPLLEGAATGIVQLLEGQKEILTELAKLREMLGERLARPQAQGGRRRS